MKKIFAILLACALILSTMPIVVLAEDESHDEIYSELQCECADKQPVDEEYQSSVPANCMSVAYDVYLCETCGLHYTRVTGDKDPTNHVGIKNVEASDPTCTEDGHEAYWECYYEHNGQVLSCGANNKVVIPAPGHDYEEIVTDPTCVADGYTTYDCRACDYSYEGNPVDALGHDFGDWFTTTDPDCVNEGEETRECSRCDAFETQPVYALDHTEVVDTAVDPTCTETGLTEGKHCSVCNEVLVPQNPVDALGHDWNEIDRVDASCYEDGVIYYECSRCDAEKEEPIPSTQNHTYTVTELPATCTSPIMLKHVCSVCQSELIIPKAGSEALGHDFGDWNTTLEPDCVNAGEERRECSRCDVFETQPIDALGHAPETIPEVPADCLNSGWTEGTKCSRCDVIIVAPQPIAPLNHPEKEVVKGYPNTCSTDGLTDGEKCSLCGVTLVEQQVIPADPEAHVTKITVERIEPTCTTVGYTHTIGCTECKAIIAHPQELPIDPNAHKYSSVVTDPTCTEDGYTTHTCDLCGYSYEDATVPALDHDWDNGVVTDPTCEADGYTTYTCKNDSTHTKVGDPVPAPGHTAGEKVVENKKDPDCENDGSYDEVEYCTVCEIELSRKTITVPSPGHDLTEVEAQAPTCTEIGWDAYEYCTVCDYTTYVELPEKGHEHGETQGVVLPTCTERGYSICVCIVCEEIYIDGEGEEYDALGHTPGEVVVENNVDPDCETDGSYDNVVYCTVCKVELERETIPVPALKHTPGEVVVENNVDPDCENNGSYDNVVYCTVCGKELSRVNNTVDALGHTEGDVRIVDVVAADCVNNGSYDEVTHCVVCFKELSRETITVPAFGHTLTYVDAQAPDCTNVGWYAYEYCTVCRYTTYVELEALGHEPVVDEAVAATYDTTGLTEGSHCDVCGEIIIRQEVIPALSEMITFSYKVTGINGVANATNSGLIYLTVYATVNELYADVLHEQARMWGVDLEIAFADCVNLVDATGTMFPVFLTTPYDLANTNNSVKISSTMSMTQPENALFTAGTHEFAVLTFKVADNYYQKDVSFNVVQCDVVRNEEANDLFVKTGILENVEEGIDLPEATIYVAMLGDANLDGYISGSDSLAMSIWATSDEVANDMDAYNTVFDMDKNGIIDGRDFLLLGKAVVGDNEYLG